jgi:hypothetical protein
MVTASSALDKHRTEEREAPRNATQVTRAP